ncbi:MAG: DUF5688 family protein [Lachnospiraceae bacterium]|nr:DUF5688 family protein [Lachnospiraceae bacterium]
MKYEEFTELVKDRLNEVCGPEFSVSVYEALKNNSVTLRGLSIKEQGSNISPTIYMDEFYTDYCDGRSLEEIVNDILRIYSENRLCPDIETDRFNDFEWIKDRLFFKLINAKENITLLQQVPNHPVMDLAMVYGVYMGEFRGSFSSVLVKNEHMKIWGCDETILRETAYANTPDILPAQVCTMGEMLSESVTDIEIPKDAIPMYVMTNRKRLNGAATMLYDGLIMRFAQNIGSDLFIIPSSIHELILVPDDGRGEPEAMKDMIREVNDTQVSKEEILSYSLYRYSVKKDRLEMAASDQGILFDLDIASIAKKVATVL